jgi:acyl-CoA dehydrogenase
MIPVPMDTPGVKIEQMLSVFGYDDAPYGRAGRAENVRVPASNMLLGEGGRASRAGAGTAGRIHHRMRTIGLAERALELMCKRLMTRVAFGKEPSATTSGSSASPTPASTSSSAAADAQAAYSGHRRQQGRPRRDRDDQGRGATYGTLRNRRRRQALRRRVSQTTPLAGMWAGIRTLRFADGPDEVHKNQIAKLELKKYT